MKQIRLLQVDTTFIPDAEKNPYGHACMEGIKRLQDEAASLAALPVPASFTGHIPDTPEAHAARAQAYQVKHIGVTYDQALMATEK